ncbi:hypothetical protein M427DRAFT_54013 [Gonapodya prolifera JEL478]|uniref:Uncharacterized protein n=1 Tax=Gonapodya prolifera (strain JEL478) TaxID=1344416 RepID=A0A139AN36_GONPJ|nr:hypothetical protein M427DRAFT_54013 [Gonapodya prolifera JEL478]|eukprot:KXS18181.1 hypothetical protein M427DRAFT_54013 [Gonapodya prolifera JEL478]
MASGVTGRRMGGWRGRTKRHRASPPGAAFEGKGNPSDAVESHPTRPTIWGNELARLWFDRAGWSTTGDPGLVAAWWCSRPVVLPTALPFDLGFLELPGPTHPSDAVSLPLSPPEDLLLTVHKPSPLAVLTSLSSPAPPLPSIGPLPRLRSPAICARVSAAGHSRCSIRSPTPAKPSPGPGTSSPTVLATPPFLAAAPHPFPFPFPLTDLANGVFNPLCSTNSPPSPPPAASPKSLNASHGSLPTHRVDHRRVSPTGPAPIGAVGAEDDHHRS